MGNVRPCILITLGNDKRFGDGLCYMASKGYKKMIILTFKMKS